MADAAGAGGDGDGDGGDGGLRWSSLEDGGADDDHDGSGHGDDGVPGASDEDIAVPLNGALPDAGCTPGALNPSVTQADVASTICTVGWTDTVRPATAVTDHLKAEVATAYGLGDPLSTFEGDHLIPLELGGAPADVANFWDEPMSLKLPDGTVAASSQKDTLENALKAKVCTGQLALLDAQRQIATDWLGTWTAAGKPGAVAATPSTSTTVGATTTTARPTTTTAAPVATTASPVVATTVRVNPDRPVGCHRRGLLLSRGSQRCDQDRRPCHLQDDSHRRQGTVAVLRRGLWRPGCARHPSRCAPHSTDQLFPHDVAEPKGE